MVRETRYLLVGNLPDPITEEQIAEYFGRQVLVYMQNVARGRWRARASCERTDCSDASESGSDNADWSVQDVALCTMRQSRGLLDSPRALSLECSIISRI